MGALVDKRGVFARKESPLGLARVCHTCANKTECVGNHCGPRFRLRVRNGSREHAISCWRPVDERWITGDLRSAAPTFSSQIPRDWGFELAGPQ